MGLNSPDGHPSLHVIIICEEMTLPIRVDFIFFLTCKKTGTILPFCTSRRDTGTHLTKPGQIPENRDIWSPYSRPFGVDCVAINFSGVIQWCYLHPTTIVHQFSLRVRGWYRHSYLFACCGEVSGCAWSRNFCPGRGLNLGPGSLMAANVTTRLPNTPIILLHRASIACDLHVKQQSITTCS